MNEARVRPGRTITLCPDADDDHADATEHAQTHRSTLPSVYQGLVATVTWRFRPALRGLAGPTGPRKMAPTDTTSTDDRNASTTEADANASWRAEYAFQGADASIEPNVLGSARDRFAAATRSDRSLRYRRKHAMGVTT